jgi:hypothetical protein
MAALLPLLLAMASTTTPPSVSDYDVVWTSPSEDAAGSMPIGNGEVVLNVWVERVTGDLLFYIARGDALSEISRILKLGRVRVHFSDSPWRTARDFRQHLRLRDGVMQISGGGTELSLYVDPAAHVVHLTGSSRLPREVTATLEVWRNAPRALPKEEKESAWSVHDAPFELIESADVVSPTKDAIEWYHRNESSVVPRIWENQSLTGLPGIFDPLMHRTFGGRIVGKGFVRKGDRSLASNGPRRQFDLSIGTHVSQTENVSSWRRGLSAQLRKSPSEAAKARNTKWWNDFWERSWVFVDGDLTTQPVPRNSHPLTKGASSAGTERFAGEIENGKVFDKVLSLADARELPSDGMPAFTGSLGFTVYARVRPSSSRPGRIFDKITPGGSDGFLFDTFPGDGLRLIVGTVTLQAPKVLEMGKWQEVMATYDPSTGEAAIFRDGHRVAFLPGADRSLVTRGYVLQSYVQACQGRGAYPMKFNGGSYTVEPKAMGRPFNADWRNWGDCHWFQNVRHMTHPMLASGDWEMTDPFFRLYESARPLAESRTRLYHGVEGAYFPETMTVFGTYSGGDYGWDRRGRQPKEVLSPWWDDAWNQGPELVALMLDRWEYTRDEAFLRRRLIPMAESVLRYFDTRFRKDAKGRIVLDPTQVVETYWEGVVNDMPSTAGLISVTERLRTLPHLTKAQRTFFERMRASCPELPIEVDQGGRELAPAQRCVPKRSNVENGELYAVWPFRLVTLSQPALLAEAKRAYEHRGNHLDVGWGYDGNVAALLGMTDEAERILEAKVRNSNPAYRWPATWGPNFDWLPDQNHGGNLLHQTQLMLLQGDPLEQGGEIRILPAWPKVWDVDFSLRAPGKTTVRCVARRGRIVSVEVTPANRLKDVKWPEGWSHP